MFKIKIEQINNLGESMEVPADVPQIEIEPRMPDKLLSAKNVSKK